MKKKIISFVLTVALLNLFWVGVRITTSADAKPEIKVYLLAGQSNMNGVGYTTDLTPEQLNPDTNVLAYSDSICTHQEYGMKMAKLNGYLGIEFGPELNFGLDMEKAYPADKIALIKWARVATSIYNNWDPARIDKTFDCYTGFLNTVNTQMEVLSADYTPVIVGMIWMQGEGDALNAEYARVYEKKLKKFIATVKTDLNCPDLKFVIGRISDSAVWPYRATVRTAQVNAAAAVADTAWIDTDDLPLRADGMHYTSAGQLTLGSRFAAAMKELIDTPEPTSSVSSSSAASSTQQSSQFSSVSAASSASSTGTSSSVSSAVSSDISKESGADSGNSNSDTEISMESGSQSIDNSNPDSTSDSTGSVQPSSSSSALSSSHENDNRNFVSVIGIGAAILLIGGSIYFVKHKRRIL